MLTITKSVDQSGKLNDFGFHTHGTSSYSMAAVKTEQRCAVRQAEREEEGKRKVKLKALLFPDCPQGRRGQQGQEGETRGGVRKTESI